jgi:hypothetical protein
MVGERRAQRAVDFLQAVVLSSRAGDSVGRHRGALGSAKSHLQWGGAVGKILSSSTLSTAREQIVQRRFSGAVIIRLLSVGPA